MPFETFLGRLKVKVTGVKFFCTVVVLKEEKCYSKHFFKYVEGQGHT